MKLMRKIVKCVLRTLWHEVFNKLWKRLTSFFLVFLTIAMCLLGNYQDAYASSASLATDSNLSYSDDIIRPVVDIVPVNAPIARTPIAIAAGTYYIVGVILVACGVYLSSEELRQFTVDFITWAFTIPVDEETQTELDRLLLGVGGGFTRVYGLLHTYLQEKWSTYDMNPDDYVYFGKPGTITTTKYLSYAWASNNARYFFSFESIGGHTLDAGVVSGTPYWDLGYCFYYTDDARIAVLYFTDALKTKTQFKKISCYNTIPLASRVVSFGLDFAQALADFVDVPVFQTYADANAYMLAGADSAVTGFQSASTGVLWPDLVGIAVDSFVINHIPTDEEWEEIDAILSGAVTSNEALEAISSVAVVNGGNVGEIEEESDWEIPAIDGLLDILKAILSALYGLPAQIAISLVSKLVSALASSSIGLNISSITSLVSDIASWDFANWDLSLAAAVASAILGSGMVSTVIGISDVISNWDFANWDISLAAAIASSLSGSGMVSTVIGISDVISNWDFANWEVSLGTAVASAIFGTGLVSAVIGISDVITDWDLTLEDVITDALTVTGVNTLTDVMTDIYAGVLSIPGTLTDSLAGIGSKVDSLTDSIASALAIEAVAEGEEEYQISSIISNKFPFCIPFDLIACIKVLEANSIPPRWEIPFVVDLGFASANETVVIDLSTEQWQPPIKVIRGFMLLFYIIGLVVLTRRLIKG